MFHEPQSGNGAQEAQGPALSGLRVLAGQAGLSACPPGMHKQVGGE